MHLEASLLKAKFSSNWESVEIYYIHLDTISNFPLAMNRTLVAMQKISCASGPWFEWMKLHFWIKLYVYVVTFEFNLISAGLFDTLKCRGAIRHLIIKVFLRGGINIFTNKSCWQWWVWKYHFIKIFRLDHSWSHKTFLKITQNTGWSAWKLR